MYCPQCGAETKEGGKFCQLCGTKLPEQKSTTSVQDAEPAHTQPQVESLVVDIAAIRRMTQKERTDYLTKMSLAAKKEGKSFNAQEVLNAAFPSSSTPSVELKCVLCGSDAHLSEIADGFVCKDCLNKNGIYTTSLLRRYDTVGLKNYFAIRKERVANFFFNKNAVAWIY